MHQTDGNVIRVPGAEEDGTPHYERSEIVVTIVQRTATIRQQSNEAANLRRICHQQ